MVTDKFDAVKVGKGEDLITLTRWVISQQLVSYTKKLYGFFSNLYT